MGFGSNNPGGRRRRGFTLAELLVVIAVIVLVIAMAVPLFKIMSSDRSVESGQNLVSAMLQQARARAIGLQAPRGIFFFEDQATKKTAMVLVKINDPSILIGANPNANVIELDEEADAFGFLPLGVGAAFVLGNNPSGSAGPVYRPYGLVAFDESGRIMTIPSYSLYATGDPAYSAPPGSPPGTLSNTWLRFRYASNIGADVMDALGRSKAAADAQFSSATMLLYDKVPFSGQTPPVGTPVLAFSPQQSAWLDNNGFSLTVNRYNGTILKTQ